MEITTQTKVILLASGAVAGMLLTLGGVSGVGAFNLSVEQRINKAAEEQVFDRMIELDERYSRQAQETADWYDCKLAEADYDSYKDEAIRLADEAKAAGNEAEYAKQFAIASALDKQAEC